MDILTTGAGGVPFTDWQQASQHVLTHYRLPFLPEPNRAKPSSPIPPMIRAVIPDALCDELESGAFDGLAEFFESDGTSTPVWNDVDKFLTQTDGIQKIKVQLIGPFTLTRVLQNFLPQLSYEALSSIVQRYYGKLFDQISRRIIRSVLVVFDDPLLSHHDLTKSPDWFDALRGAQTNNIQYGLHLCQNISELNLATALRDLWIYPDLTLFSPSEWDQMTSMLEHLLKENVGIVYGVVNTSKAAVVSDQVMQLCKVLHTNHTRHSEQTMIIAPGCGTSLKSKEFEGTVAECLETARNLLVSQE